MHTSDVKLVGPLTCASGQKKNTVIEKNAYESVVLKWSSSVVE